MLNPAPDYDTLYGQFAWALPRSYNIAWHVCDRHAAAMPNSPALVYEGLDGNVTTYDFAQVQRLANRVANMLAADGIAPGDRVAVILPQGLETAVSHLGASKLGAISVPMFAQLGEGALRHRLIDSGASVIITNRAVHARLGALLPELLALRSVYLIDGPESGARDFTTELTRASDRRETLATTPDTPAMLYYTSGTTGPPEGGAARPSLPTRRAAGSRAVSRFLRPQGRFHVVARRLGLARRPVGSLAANLGARQAYPSPGKRRSLRSGTGVSHPGAPGRAQRIACRHNVEANAPGRPATSARAAQYFHGR
jgi:acetyl-CoA synthetase